MNDAFQVGSVESVGNLNAEPENLVQGERPAADLVLERLALEKLHNDERLSSMFIYFVNGADVGMVKRRCGSSFTLEALEGLAVRRQLFGQEFESDGTPKLEVLGFVHHAHSAAELLENAVMGDDLTNH